MELKMRAETAYALQAFTIQVVHLILWTYYILLADGPAE
jgi:hypothetical protein